MIFPDLLRSDPKPIEVSTAIILASLSVWCSLYGWFGGWFASLAGWSGYEPAATALGVAYAAVQVLVACKGSLVLRSYFCMTTASVIGVLCAAIIFNKGMEAPGVPVSLSGIGIFSVAYIQLVLANARRT